MSSIFFCILIGYCLGCLNPAWLVAKITHTDLRNSGTNNLGATNTFMEAGHILGIGVMIFDIGKALAATLICRTAFPEVALGGLIAGCCAILGHMFPFYLKFKGGKGLACLGGLVLGLDWRLFLLLLTGCLLVAIITNYGAFLSITGAILVPISFGLAYQSLVSFVLLAIPCGCIINKHRPNIRRIRVGEEKPFRTFFTQRMFKNRKKKDDR